MTSSDQDGLLHVHIQLPYLVLLRFGSSIKLLNLKHSHTQWQSWIMLTSFPSRRDLGRIILKKWLISLEKSCIVGQGAPGIPLAKSQKQSWLMLHRERDLLKKKKAKLQFTPSKFGQSSIQSSKFWPCQFSPLSFISFQLRISIHIFVKSPLVFNLTDFKQIPINPNLIE